MKRAKPFIDETREFLRSLNPEGQERIIHATNDLTYCPFFLVASIFFGTLTAEQREELYKLGPPREELFRDTFMGGINRYAIAKYFPGSAMPRLRTFQKKWEAFVREAYGQSASGSRSPCCYRGSMGSHGKRGNVAERASPDARRVSVCQSGRHSPRRVVELFSEWLRIQTFSNKCERRCCHRPAMARFLPVQREHMRVTSAERIPC